MNEDFKKIYDDVMSVAYHTRSMKTRIEKLQNLGYLVMVNSYLEGCYKYGDRTTEYEHINMYQFGCITRYTSQGLLGRTFGNAWYIQISRNNGEYHDFPMGRWTVFVVIPDLNLRKLYRKMKMNKIESNIV